MDQALQILGALLILAGFTLAQLGVLEPRSYPYLLLNLVGSLILAALAAIDRLWGFLLLEGVWALVSLGSLLGRLRADRTGRAP